MTITIKAKHVAIVIILAVVYFIAHCTYTAVYSSGECHAQEKYEHQVDSLQSRCQVLSDSLDYERSRNYDY